MDKVCWAMRTYGRSQLLGTLCSIYASEIKGNVYLIGVERSDLSTAIQVMADFLDQLGWHVIYRKGNYPTTTGGNLYYLVESVCQLEQEAEKLLLIDDDCFFRREHVLKALAAGKNCATYVPLHLGENYSQVIIDLAQENPVLDMFFSWLDLKALRSIPLQRFEILLQISTSIDMPLFSRILTDFGGFKLRLLTESDRPLHILIQSEKRKPWGFLPIQVYDNYIQNLFAAESWQQVNKLALQYEAEILGQA